MRSLKLLVAVGVAAVASTGALATSASAALPEFIVPNGLTSLTETVEGTASGTSAVFEDHGGLKVKCARVESTPGNYAFVETKELSFSLVYTGCYGNAQRGTGEKCTTPGEPAGNIALVSHGEFGYINRAAKKVGALFEGYSESTAEGDFDVFTIFGCEPAPGVVSTYVTSSGAAVGEVSPVDKETTTVKIKLTQSKSEQKLAFEGNLPLNPTAILEGGRFRFGGSSEPAGITSSVTLTMSKAVFLAA